MFFLLTELFDDAETNQLIDEYINDTSALFFGDNYYHPTQDDLDFIKGFLLSEIGRLLNELHLSAEMPNTLSGLLELLAMLQHELLRSKKLQQRHNQIRVKLQESITSKVDRHIHTARNFLVMVLLSAPDLCDLIQILRLELEHKIGMHYSR